MGKQTPKKQAASPSKGMAVTIYLDETLLSCLNTRQDELEFSLGRRLPVAAVARSALVRGLTLARR